MRSRLSQLHPIPDDFYARVSSLAENTIYHTREWHRVLARSFGWEVRALIAERDGEVVWWLPFVRKRRLLTRRVQVALPLSHRIGPAGLSSERGTPFAVPPELVPLEVHDEVAGPGAVQKRQYDTTLLDFSGFENERDLLMSFDNKSIRYMIRRAERENVEISSTADDRTLEDFTALMRETRHRQGSPMYPTDFFRNIRDSFRATDAFRLYVGYLEGAPAAAAAFFHHGDHTVYAYSASVSDREVKKNGTSERVMWEAIRESFGLGKRYMDFGISPKTLPGLRQYKEKWGGVSRELPYTVFPGEVATGGGVQRDSTLVKAASKVFRTMPRALFVRLSPIVLREVL